MKRFIALITVCLFLSMMNGCRKGQSVIQDTTPPPEPPKTEVNRFANVDTSGAAVFQEANLADDLARQAAAALQTIYFEYNSYQLNMIAFDQLQVAASFLKSNEGLRILVIGHCDERGSSEYNIGLGEKRAKSIKDYLQNIGIEPIRIETTSYGKEQPVQSYCRDEECHSKNRRGEFRVLSR
ncbi:MAG: OmpA family protein [Fibrobacterota bacterium]|jgi:peptidoglycan-associated lipoprotein|nr:OmpA family protein [Chitinispirillaceae bacterium]